MGYSIKSLVSVCSDHPPNGGDDDESFFWSKSLPSLDGVEGWSIGTMLTLTGLWSLYVSTLQSGGCACASTTELVSTETTRLKCGSWFNWG
jgi:hypothetical protein